LTVAHRKVAHRKVAHRKAAACKVRPRGAPLCKGAAQFAAPLSV